MCLEVRWSEKNIRKKLSILIQLIMTSFGVFPGYRVPITSHLRRKNEKTRKKSSALNKINLRFVATLLYHFI